MHPTSIRFHAQAVHPHRGWRPLLWAGLISLFFLLTWQAATSFAAPVEDPAAAVGPLDEAWRFVDESKPGAPAAIGTWAATTGDAPAEVVAHFTLSSTMQALSLQLYNPSLAGQSFAQLNELSYCTRLIDSPRPYAVMLQLNLDADVTDGDRSWQGRLVYTPADNGAVIQGEWQCWDTLAGKWWATGGPVAANAPVDNPQPLAILLAQFPNLGIHSDYGAVVLKAGSGWNYFQGEASPIVVALGSEPMLLAFAPDTTPVNEPINEPVNESGEVLLPVVDQDAESGEQLNNGANNGDGEDDGNNGSGNDDKDDQKPEKEKKPKHNRQDNFDWSSVDWEHFNWDSVDWESVDWSKVDWYGDPEETAAAIRAFVADVEQCKDDGWQEMGFDDPGECVAYYIEAHIPSDLQWERNRGDNNNDEDDD